MKWLKKGIQNIKMCKCRKKINKIFNFILYLVLALIFISGALCYISIGSDISQYPIAKIELTLQLQVLQLFSIVFLFSLFTPKKLMIIVWFIALFQLVPLFNALPNIKQIWFIDTCEDINYCQNGANKEKCLKNQNAWNINDKACLYNFVKEDCNNLNETYYNIEGNWEYPDICKK